LEMEIQDSFDSSISESPQQELVHDDANQVDKVSVDELLEMEQNRRKNAHPSDSESNENNQPRNVEENAASRDEDDQDAIVSGNRRFIHEDSSHPNWPKHKKHMFIVSIAGKPIYSRYGDEQNLATFMASLVALVTYIQDMKDEMRYITAGKHKFVFVVKGPLVLVSVAKTMEPVAPIVQQLNYMHAQIISLLTSGVNQIFDRRAHYDLRALLGGADKFMDNLISWMDHSFSFLLNSIHCLRLDSPTRTNIANIMQSVQHNELLYAILVAGYQLVTLIRPKRWALHPSDLHLIMNFVHASSTFKSSESWTPLCLPKFNDTGFLHAYVCFLETNVCLLLLSTKQDASVFHQLSNCKEQIHTGLVKTGALDLVVKEMQNPDYSVGELGIPSLLHFIYKSNVTCQCTAPRMEAPYSSIKEKKRLFRLYQRIYKRVHSFKKLHKVYYQVSQLETIVAWVTSGFELYAVFGPLESKSVCIKACNEILKWIKDEETSLFILNSPVW